MEATMIGAVIHPLQPLTAEEIKTAVDTIKNYHRDSHLLRFISVVLKEPAKAIVQGFAPGMHIQREAFAVLFDNSQNACYEALVSLDSGTVLRWEHLQGVQPTMTIDEQVECEHAVITDTLFIEALRRHGVNDPSLVMVDIWSAGYYGEAEESSMRLARPLCFLRSAPTDNGYARPIEGLRPVVDLNTMTVIRIEDYGVMQLPPEGGNYSSEYITDTRKDIKPLEITQPEGPSFTVNGYEVSWQKWNVVIGFNAREGLTLHNINYDDKGEKRSVLYRASLSEMVVPYGDPTDTQKRKNAFDSGEYGMGTCANSLELGCDCLGYIHYFDAFITNSKGGVVKIKNAICMHEEDYGVLWKHTDRRLGVPEVRRSRRLVISSFSTVENYEYGFFWYFYQDGNIQLELKLTGILSMGAVDAGVTPKFGNLVAPQLYAPNHQHFFNVRLDFDLDGTANSVYEVNVESEPPGPENLYENAFYAASKVLETESQAKANLCLEKSRFWKIVNPARLNKVGQPVAYKFMAGDNCVPFASPAAYWRQRARFVDHHVWVTPYAEDELFGGGSYPNQHAGGDGLHKWTGADRNIKETDIVFWYTMGHTHIPRPEDYPVMPAAYIGFLLKPAGFFDKNPANDVPASPGKRVATHAAGSANGSSGAGNGSSGAFRDANGESVSAVNGNGGSSCCH